MDRSGRPGNTQEGHFGAPRVPIQRVRRRLFSTARTSGAVVLTRRRVLPLVDTPHILNAVDYFRDVAENYEVLEPDNEVAQRTEQVDGNESPVEQGLQGDPYSKRSSHKRRRKAVVSSGISVRPNLKKTLNKSKDFLRKSRIEVNDLFARRMCAASKKGGLDNILERGQILVCTVARASGKQGLTESDCAVIKRLQVVVQRLEKSIQDCTFFRTLCVSYFYLLIHLYSHLFKTANFNKMSFLFLQFKPKWKGTGRSCVRPELKTRGKERVVLCAHN
ncbi:unnamed protein product [Orchesella dallaii]|uniref:Uncharacterized protein n=1 Tax=Orchesella dallaii TaxID=48710 RepID=A0ABP1RRQ8_9HEXA